MEMKELFRQLGLKESVPAVPFQAAEDGRDYDVWKVESEAGCCVLKQAKGRELAVYRTFFVQPVPGVPQFYKSVRYEGEDYFLMEYFRGQELLRCDRQSLTAALDVLIALQERFWERRDLQGAGWSFEEGWQSAQKRGKYLGDPELERAYVGFLELYADLPRTLCHDDLLPFNVLVSEDGAAIIDWEYAGILPYPASLIRLLAHGEETEGAFFYMREEDKDFAIDYYYERLVAGKGISYGEYRRAVDYFLLYEYCEWIMLGNKYDHADPVRFQKYLAKAREHVKQLT